MRGLALSTLRTKLKAEIRDSSSANAAADADYNQLLINRQIDLANAYDWPFLRREWTLALSQGDRYKSIPTVDIRSVNATINFARPVQVHVLYNSSYQEVGMGIGTDEYNQRDPADNEQQDPVMKWDFATNIGETANANQIEIWPMPASAQTLRFTGQREPNAVAVDADKFDLDDLLIVYSLAADILTHREAADAAEAVKKAQRHLIKLRAGYPTDSEPIILGRSNKLSREQRRVISITTVG